MCERRYGNSIWSRQVRLCLTTFVVLSIVLPVVRAQTEVGEKPSRNAATPKLEISSTVWDFGEKWAGEPAETTITLKNAGDAPLRIEKVKSSCGCTVAQVKQKLLQPGESEEVKITYNTQKRVENVSQQVRVYSNDPAEPTTTIEVKGRIRQVVKIIEGRGLNLGKLGHNDVVTQSVEIECTYTEPLELKLKEMHPEQLDVRLEEIEAGRRYRLTATTKPPLRDGAIRANARLLTGVELVPEIPVRIWGTVQAPVAVSPKALYISGQMGKSTQRIVRVTTRRDQPLTITDVTTSDPAIKAEILPPSAQRPQASADSNVTMIRVTLPPAGELPAAGATITIVTDDEEYTELVVPVHSRP